MKEFSENTLKSANIDVDIKKGKVNFKYPKKEKEFQGWLNIYLELVLIWLLIIGIISLIVGIFYLIISFFSSHPSQINKESLYIALAVFSLALLIMNIPPLIILEIILIFFKDKIYKINPSLQFYIHSFLSGHYEKIYKNINSKEIFIPEFANVGIKYRAYEDYAKYLKRIQIIDEPIKKVKRTKIKDDYYWYAKFSFTKVPKKGYLHIKWI